MSETVTASDGTALPIDSLPQVFAYSGSFLSTITVVYADNLGVENTYVQTFTNNGTEITAISRWVKQ